MNIAAVGFWGCYLFALLGLFLDFRSRIPTEMKIEMLLAELREFQGALQKGHFQLLPRTSHCLFKMIRESLYKGGFDLSVLRFLEKCLEHAMLAQLDLQQMMQLTQARLVLLLTVSHLAKAFLHVVFSNSFHMNAGIFPVDELGALVALGGLRLYFRKCITLLPTHWFWQEGMTSQGEKWVRSLVFNLTTKVYSNDYMLEQKRIFWQRELGESQGRWILCEFIFTAACLIALLGPTLLVVVQSEMNQLLIT